MGIATLAEGAPRRLDGACGVRGCGGEEAWLDSERRKKKTK